MNGIVRKEQMKHERIIRQLWFKMNDVDHPRDKKKLAYAIEYHVQLLDNIKQLHKVAA
jgi:hypothetical protein|tara:strand:+ start:97 stop:270 length:174 start_codon:yes stop_codon:yes gene_type:complete